MEKIKLAGISKKEADAIVKIGYYTILNRKPDDVGLSYWSAKLQSGSISENEFIASLYESNEYKKNLK